jgi:hypothetical protein
VRGKVYEIPEPSAEDGARLPDLVSDNMGILQLTDEALYYLTPPVVEEMVADGLKWTEIQHCGRTAMVYFGHSVQMGEVYWQAASLASAMPADLIEHLSRKVLPSES